MTELLSVWVGQNSYSRNLEGLAAMEGLLREAFAGLPGEVESIPLPPGPEFTSQGEAVKIATGNALRVRCRPEAAFRILVSGHYDTVFPPGDAFREATIRNGRMHGPGAADMKGGLMILLEALRHFESHCECRDLGWDLIVVPDEEIGTHSSRHLYVEAAPSVQAALVVEPRLPDGSLARARRGSGTFNAVVTGRAAHVGRSFEEGRSAVHALARLITAIHGLNGQVPGAVFNAGRIDGGGALNVVADRAAAQFNFRVADPADVPVIEERVEEIRSRIESETDCAILWEGGFTRPPKPCTPAMEAMFTQIKTLGGQLGMSLIWNDTGGCCDGNNLAALGIPNIDTLGVVGAGIHSNQEYAELDSLPRGAALLSLLLYDWGTGNIPPGLGDGVD